jgi:hypothetical protein
MPCKKSREKILPDCQSFGSFSEPCSPIADAAQIDAVAGILASAVIRRMHRFYAVKTHRRNTPNSPDKA